MPNWVQITADMKRGLSKLRDESVHLITSEMAVGYFLPQFHELMKGQGREEAIEEYTGKVLQVAHAKLSQGGKVHLVAGVAHLEPIKRALAKAGFEQEKIVSRKLSGNETQRTHWMRKHGKLNIGLWQIIAEK